MNYVFCIVPGTDNSTLSTRIKTGELFYWGYLGLLCYEEVLSHFLVSSESAFVILNWYHTCRDDCRSPKFSPTSIFGSEIRIGQGPASGCCHVPSAKTDAVRGAAAFCRPLCKSFHNLADNICFAQAQFTIGSWRIFKNSGRMHIPVLVRGPTSPTSPTISDS